MIKGFQIDVARQIERPELLLESIRRLGTCGYNVCMLYLEGAYEYPGCEGIGRRHAYSPAFVRQIHDACEKTGMELIPVIPALGHCAYITKTPGYEKYDEGYDSSECYGTLVAGREDTYELLTALFDSWCSRFSGKFVHVGLDESPHMGLSHIRRNGKESFDAAAVFAAHCNRLHAILKHMNRRMIMWGDMLYYFPAAIEKLDRDIIVADWYYYSFDRTPCVEVFNFSEIDLTGDLKKAGFEVWGIPSVWPNYPFPDIADRLANIRSWWNYGRERGIDGIINTDWENSFGFFCAAELLFATFGCMWPSLDEKLLPAALTETIKKMTGLKPEDGFIQDLLSLGNCHLTGHANRVVLARPALGMVSTAQPRIDEFREKAKKLRGMFPKIDAMREACRLREGQNLLRSISLCHRLLYLFWHACAVLSALYARLSGGRIEVSETAAELRGLADALDAFCRDYTAFWARVRYEDDPQSVSRWAASVADEMRGFAERLAGGDPWVEHPMLSCPLLEIEMECSHPALPVLGIEIRWDDGAVQKTQQIMIKFESAYAVPDKNWRQYASIPLDKRRLPDELVFTAAHYGQIGVRRVSVACKGKRHLYAVSKTEGAHIITSDCALLIGPVAATPTDPTHRLDCDKAYYRERNRT